MTDDKRGGRAEAGLLVAQVAAAAAAAAAEALVKLREQFRVGVVLIAPPRRIVERAKDAWLAEAARAPFEELQRACVVPPLDGLPRNTLLGVLGLPTDTDTKGGTCAGEVEGGGWRVEVQRRRAVRRRSRDRHVTCSISKTDRLKMRCSFSLA